MLSEDGDVHTAGWKCAKLYALAMWKRPTGCREYGRDITNHYENSALYPLISYTMRCYHSPYVGCEGEAEALPTIRRDRQLIS